MKNTVFNSEISGIWHEAESDFQHPLLRRVRFILTDNKPNSNNQGIEYEDFELLKNSAIDMPIKMRFMGDDVLGHRGSMTVGHIRAVSEEAGDDGVFRLIADGVLYADEFPNEIDYLEKAFSEGNAPGISWEVNYKDEKKEGLISWLKGAITKAATFVKNPAYGARTAILALASDATVTDEELFEGISTITQKFSPRKEEEGGNNTVEEELKKLQEQLETLQKELETEKAAKAELEAKVTSQDEIISEYKKATVIAERTKKVMEAGLKLESDKLERKQEFWATLTEEAFAEYLADITAATKATKSSQASAAEGLPKIDPPSDGETVTLNELRTKMRTLSRA